MNNYLYAIAISILFADMSGIPQRIKWAYKFKQLKPLDCSMCLSFWISLCVGYLLHLHLLEIIGRASIASCLTVIFMLLYRKL